jgi:hypothetical protein
VNTTIHRGTEGFVAPPLGKPAIGRGKVLDLEYLWIRFSTSAMQHCIRELGNHRHRSSWQEDNKTDEVGEQRE